MLAPQVDSLAQTPCHAEPLPGDAEGSSRSWEATEVKCLMRSHADVASELPPTRGRMPFVPSFCFFSVLRKWASVMCQFFLFTFYIFNIRKKLRRCFPGAASTKKGGPWSSRLVGGRGEGGGHG